MSRINWKQTAKAGVVGLMFAAASTVFAMDAAQAQASTCDEKKSSASKTLSPKIYKIVEEVQILFEADQIAQAKGLLDSIRDQNALAPYDRTVIMQFYAQIYVEKDEYLKAADALAVVIRLGECILPPEQINQTVFNIGQLYIGAEQYRKGMKYLSDWFKKNPDPSASALAFMAQANLGIEPPDYPEALKWMTRAIDKSIAMGEEPRESWYSTVVALYMETEQMSKALPVLELLVDRHPKRTYWMQLSYVYGELNREDDQFSTLQSAYHQGLLTKSQELVYLAQLYMANSIPVRASDIMEKGLKAGSIEKKPENIRFLADALYTAKELDRAITWYEEAGKVADTAQTYFMLGQIYMQQEEWKKAVAAFENTLSKNRQAGKDKKLREIGTAHYNLGIALYSAGKPKAAKKSFTTAKGYSNMRKGANQWLARIAAES
jgi:tetratricopeptide (TPR) repeat protein